MAGLNFQRFLLKSFSAISTEELFSVSAEELLPCPGGLTSVSRPALSPFHIPNLNRIRAHGDTSAKLRECLGYGKALPESIAFCRLFSQEMREDEGHEEDSI